MSAVAQLPEPPAEPSAEPSAEPFAVPPAAPASAAEMLAAEPLAAQVLSHLATQLGSAERLLAIVVQQAAAIRARDVHEVVRLAGLMQGEIQRREEIELHRAELLRRAGRMLGVAPEGVTIGLLASLMAPADAEQAISRSATLRGLLEELQREHTANRALMRVELSFLNHLLATLSLDGEPGYDASGTRPAGPRANLTGQLHVLDLEV